MPSNTRVRSGGAQNWKKIATTTSKAPTGHRHVSRSACSVRMVTPRCLGERLRFRQRSRREIHGQNVEALLGEEHPVAAFAVGDGQRLLAGLEQIGLALEEGVRLGAEMISRPGKSRFPAFEFRHHVPQVTMPGRVIDARGGWQGQSGRFNPALRALGRRALALGAPDFRERIFAVEREFFEEARHARRSPRATRRKQQVVDAPQQRIDRADRGLALGRQPHQHAAAVARAGLLGEQALADQPADLGGHMRRGELGVVGERRGSTRPRCPAGRPFRSAR